MYFTKRDWSQDVHPWKRIWLQACFHWRVNILLRSDGAQKHVHVWEISSVSTTSLSTPKEFQCYGNRQSSLWICFSPLQGNAMHWWTFSVYNTFSYELIPHLYEELISGFLFSNLFMQIGVVYFSLPEKFNG